jgi:transcriptional regulator with GAF, ATPase, and Fis domain
MKVPDQKNNIEHLFKIIREMIPERDLDTLLEKVINASTQILGADRALLFLFDQKNKSLVFKFGVNIEEALIGEAHQFSSSVLEKAKRGETIMTSDSQEEDDFSDSESIQTFDIKTVLCAPIMTNGKLFGVIYADTRGSEIFLDDEMREYFLSFVDFMAEVIEGAVDLHEKADELSYLKRRLAEQTIFPEIVGRSVSIQAMKEKILRITSVDYPVSVLIMGDSGSGKELIARAVHSAGFRSGKPFMTVNCAAIPATLMESELFGHEKGAFTGALSRKLGFFEKADGGVIFLDEIGDLPHELQPKLLRILQFGTFTRVGSNTELAVDVQILCATSKDLHREMEEERFRKALFHRLAVEVIHVPPLRDRKEDILLLANHFMRFFSDKMAKPLTGIETSAQKILAGYDYSDNNVRELKNVIERAVLASEGKQISVKDIVFSDELLFGPEVEKTTPEPGEILDKELIHINEGLVVRLFEDLREKDDVERNMKPYYQVYEEMERKLILISLRQSDWKIKPAANLLGINHTNFRPKMKAMLSEYSERCEGDIYRISREYNIPLSFLKRRHTD